jgi:hypothetical protein
MKDILILFLSGVFFVLVGVLVQKKDKKQFKDPIMTKAKVISYDEYQSSGGPSDHIQQGMYTMNVSYSLLDGTIIETKEQSGSNKRKYQVGEYIDIMYSREKNDLFQVCGDYTRKIGLVIITILGLGLIGVSFYMLWGFM